jgi:uncharacterized protein YdhG (YjbR/CyaY superfamily)
VRISSPRYDLSPQGHSHASSNIIKHCGDGAVERRKQFSTIDEYIASFPKQIQDILKELRRTIKESAPQAQEAISYQIPTFKLNGNLVHFGAFKDHIGFFPTSSGVAAFRKELSEYEVSKGTIRFPLDKPIPFDLVRKIVKFRVNKNLQKEVKRIHENETRSYLNITH